MELSICKNDLALRIVKSLVRLPANSVKVSTDASTMLLNGKLLNGSFAIAQQLLTNGKLTKLLGDHEEEKTLVFQYGLEAEKKWVDAFKADRAGAIKDLNSLLSNRTFLATNEFTLADVFMYATLYAVPFYPQDRLEFPNVIRYFDLIQNIVKSHDALDGLKTTEFDLDVPFVPKPAEVKAPKEAKKEDKGSKKAAAEPKEENQKAGAKNAKGTEAKPAKAAETKKEETLAFIEPSKLDIRVGKILSVEQHPDAEALYVESVDLGEAAPRTVVSGLVKYMTADQLQDQTVVLLCNLKPAKMRGIESQAMVLCATSSDGNTVEFLQPPKGSKPGDICKFEGFNGEPVAQLKSKQKIWESIQPNLFTNGKRQACFIYPDGSKKESLLKAPLGEILTKTVTGAPIK